MYMCKPTMSTTHTHKLDIIVIKYTYFIYLLFKTKKTQYMSPIKVDFKYF